MAFVDGLFGKPTLSAIDDHMNRIIAIFEDAEKKHLKEIQERRDAAAAQGMLPPPDIAIDYDCECGAPNTFRISAVPRNLGPFFVTV